MSEESPPLFPIHDLTAELPWHHSLRWATRDITKIDTVVVHHSATEMRPGDTTRAHIYAINKRHIERNRWPRIGYHFVVGPKGVIWKCNALENRTYHAGNLGVNGRSVGVCLVGDMTEHDPTDEQLEALRWLVGQLGYPAIGHCEVVRTACPGTWWDANKAWVNGEGLEAAGAQIDPPEAEGCAGTVQLAWELARDWLAWQWERLRGI